MINKILAWCDDRTGYKNLVNEALYENIPGGSRWRYVWGSTLMFTFSIQMITGIFLWMCYSPSSRSAWESVYYIQYEMQGGWLLRGIHHFTAQAMIVLLALHLLQIVIDGAYRAPREFNFWIGLILMQIVLGLSLTGYLLPWDQKGFWATNVATNLMALVPVVGPDIQKVVVGGPTYGHATLTRFFAMHAGVLPAVLIFFIVLHLAVFRRHGIHKANPWFARWLFIRPWKDNWQEKKRSDEKFWPDQVLKDVVACLAVLAVILLFTVKGMFGGEHAGEGLGPHLGAELGSPADGATPYSAARPEWYFLFLFQFLKYFHGSIEVFGAIYIPGAIMGVLFLMPFFGRWKLGHRFNIGLIFTLLLGVGLLTFVAIREDKSNPDFAKAKEQAEINRVRALQLAQSPTGIPDSGAVSLLRSDAKTQGPILFERHCASCHAHVPFNGVEPKTENRHAIESRDPSAPNLYKYATREWMGRFLDPDQIDTQNFFGNTAHNEGDMVGFVKETLSDEDQWTRKQIDQVLLALAVEAELEGLDPEDPAIKPDLMQGRQLLADTDRCAQCHKFHEENDGAYGPDLTHYASRQWMIDFISNPNHERFYSDSNDRMPAYAKNPDPKNNVLQPKEIELMVDWLRGQWYEPAGQKAPADVTSYSSATASESVAPASAEKTTKKKTSEK